MSRTYNHLIELNWIELNWIDFYLPSCDNITLLEYHSNKNQELRIFVIYQHYYWALFLEQYSNHWNIVIKRLLKILTTHNHWNIKKGEFCGFRSKGKVFSEEEGFDRRILDLRPVLQPAHVLLGPDLSEKKFFKN